MNDSDKISILIVEDEPIVADDIQFSLEEMGYLVLGVVPSADQALNLLAQKTPDLILLDIHLEGKKDGIELAREIQELDIPIIFLTSFADRKTLERVKAVQPAGYIVKPFDDKDILANVELALYKQAQKPSPLSPSLVRQSDKPPLFFVKVKQQLLKIRAEEILWVEGADNYSFLHTAQGKFLLSRTLKKIEQQLQAQRFLRVHKSYVVALDQITAIEDAYLFIQKQAIPLGKVYKKRLMQAISTL